MASISTLSAIRFGYGLGGNPAPGTAEQILMRLARGDLMAEKFPVVATDDALAQAAEFREMKKAAEKNQGGSEQTLRRGRDAMRLTGALGLLHGVARILDTDDPFRERLTWFWADHFTAVAKNAAMRAAAPAYVDEAIRPNIGGKFGDMLKAVVTHPFMLAYLDQMSSVGPNSVVGKRRGRGLNENLAREVMELHTLGVGSSFVQADVRQLAELFTGLSFTRRDAFTFNARMAEPGAETILGKTYGGDHADLADILQALDDLAVHPDTARHISRKLATNLVADEPDASLVEAMTATYRETDGDLSAIYATMLNHPAAWGPIGGKAKQPFDYIASALLALEISGDELVKMQPRVLRPLLFQALEGMGQPFMSARGPDGWSEAAEDWITPNGLATRIAWAMGVAEHFEARIADPRRFLQNALGDAAGENLVQAVQKTATRRDAAALVLASAEFNRR
ncbi:MAG: DUF1800 family protein [Paracoccaceae bacterium]